MIKEILFIILLLATGVFLGFMMAEAVNAVLQLLILRGF